MCRNIKTLFNFDPPATHAEIHASALQFVRKLSGFNSPSQANAEAFNRAVSEVSDSARRLLAALQTNAAPRDREVEAEKARERSRARFGLGRGLEGNDPIAVHQTPARAVATARPDQPYRRTRLSPIR